MAGLDDLVPDLVPFAHALVDAAGAAGLQPRVTSTVRTRSQQRKLYSSFLANPGRAYPVAPPGSSAHEYGEAFDMVVTPMDALADVGYTWQSWGGGWNGADAVHFELPGASDRARAKGLQWKVPLYEQVITGLPFGFTVSMLFDLFGIPTVARKDVTPAQLAYLATLVPKR